MEQVNISLSAYACMFLCHIPEVRVALNENSGKCEDDGS